MTLLQSVRRRWSESAVLAAFFILSAARIARHELWRNEWGLVLIGRSADSLEAFMEPVGYGGHPRLWPFLVFLVSRVTGDPFGMQLLHLAIITLAIGIWIFRAPFSPAVRFLLPFSYYFFFEYNQISRGYCLGVLGAFLCCTFWPRSFLLTVALAVLAHSSVYGAILSVALFGAAFLFPVAGEDTVRRRTVLAAVYLPFFTISVLHMMPPADGGFVPGWPSEAGARTVTGTLRAYYRGLLPIVPPQPYFLDRVVGDGTPPVQAVFGVLLMALSAFVLRRYPAAFAVWAVNTLGILLFTYLKFSGFLRHEGQLFVGFLVAAWLIRSAPEVRTVSGRIQSSPLLRGVTLDTVLGVILLLQLPSGLYASWRDWGEPFTGAKAAAELIREQRLHELPIVAHDRHACSAIAGYLERPLFYVSDDRWGTFVWWKAEKVKVDGPLLLATARREACRSPRRQALLIINPWVSIDPALALPFAAVTESIIPEETYTFYLVECPE